ncbi:MAG TPA: S41 family peptidase [Lentimicrobium sp.]|nr:S41 family peptidase [Lentimicrobium sp.]
MKLLLFLFICTIQLKEACAQQKWNFQISFENNAIGPINTILYLEQKQDHFTLNSAKNGDSRIYGTIWSTLGRLKGLLPKKGKLLRIDEGNVIHLSEGVDSLFGKFYTPLIGYKQFKGIRKEMSISGSLFNGNKSIISLKGHPVENDFDFNYIGLSARINDTTKKYIYNPELLKDKQWKKRIIKMQRFEKKAVDDLEVLLYAMRAFQNLPFSHYGLQILGKNQAEQLLLASSNNVICKEIDSNTVVMEVKSFGGEKDEMDGVFTEILKHGYKNLIVDLRNNSGGGVDAGLAFGNHLTDKDINVGYFVTNKWVSNPSQQKNFESFSVSTSITTTGFIAELKQSEGRKLLCKPSADLFRGNVYLLINNKTASTCEPIVYALKTNKIATVIGENTAGAMLSAALFNVKDNFWIYMPIADYYTPDKTRLDQVGVSPDLVVPSDQALDYVLKMIEEKE